MKNDNLIDKNLFTIRVVPTDGPLNVIYSAATAPDTEETSDVGLLRSKIPMTWVFHKSSCMLTGSDGEIFLGENERDSHLGIYFPPIRWIIAGKVIFLQNKWLFRMIFFAFCKRGVILNNMLRLIRSSEAAPWCNGSTSDSGSFCWGSNPYGAAIFFACKNP